MFDLYLKEYDLEVSNYISEYNDLIMFESGYATEGAKDVVNNVLQSIKSLFDKIAKFIKEKLTAGKIQKNLKTVEEMINNSKTLRNKKIEIPYCNIKSSVSIKECIKRKFTKPFYDSDKKMMVTVGQAFEYVKSNANNYDKNMQATLDAINKAMQGVDTKDISCAAEIAKNYTESKKFSIFSLLKSLFEAVTYFPKKLASLVLKSFHVDSDDPDGIKVLRSGRKIRSITINGITVDVVNLKSSEECKQRFGFGGGFCAMYVVGGGYDCVAFEEEFYSYPDYQQNAIIYHELAHATQQTFGAKKKKSKLYGKSHYSNKRSEYMGDLRAAYKASLAKHKEYTGSHLNINEVEADLISAKNGAYQGRVDLLKGYIKKGPNTQNGIEGQIRLEVLETMHRKGHC